MPGGFHIYKNSEPGRGTVVSLDQGPTREPAQHTKFARRFQSRGHRIEL
jgi:hypothetical protein